MSDKEKKPDQHRYIQLKEEVYEQKERDKREQQIQFKMHQLLDGNEILDD
jgi:hypothetical protein